LVKEWYYADGKRAFRAARELLRYLADRSKHAGPAGRLVCDAVSQGIETAAGNSLNALENALGDKVDAIDAGLLIGWGLQYAKLVAWASRLSLELAIPTNERPEFQSWEQAHAAMIGRLRGLLARDAFDTLRLQSVWNQIEATYRFTEGG
jgi:hypothetical protein